MINVGLLYLVTFFWLVTKYTAINPRADSLICNPLCAYKVRCPCVANLWIKDEVIWIANSEYTYAFVRRCSRNLLIAEITASDSKHEHTRTASWYCSVKNFKQ